jgi:hypothetical protein
MGERGQRGAGRAGQHTHQCKPSLYEVLALECQFCNTGWGFDKERAPASCLDVFHVLVNTMALDMVVRCLCPCCATSQEGSGFSAMSAAVHPDFAGVKYSIVSAQAQKRFWDTSIYVNLEWNQGSAFSISGSPTAVDPD